MGRRWTDVTGVMGAAVIPPMPTTRSNESATRPVDEVLDPAMLEPGLPRDVAARIRLLRTQRDRRLLEASALAIQARTPVLRRQAALLPELAQRQAAHHRRASQRQHIAQHAEAWLAAGIQDRLATPSLAAPVRWLLVVALAALDFYVFALTVAKSDDIRVDPREPLFLLGGLLGLMVFGFGLLLAHLLKDVVYARAQARLLGEVRRGEVALEDGVDARHLVPSRTSRFLVAVMTVVFALFLGFRIALRWEGMGPNDDPNLAMLQSLIPLLALGVAFYLRDPSAVPACRPGRRLLRLTRLQSLIEDDLRRVAAEEEVERGRVQHTYDEAELLLRIESTRRDIEP